ncbi:uncharacterized protein LOC125189800 [Salvia hispanica]|uniref:uncharacterized protein LOC125189800 n=1 Tax=Salvia hispanica TaxID=49212 RepID=UPI002009B573|nr:uncharacterized protein LOC125189800 [Salvia hispanica]
MWHITLKLTDKVPRRSLENEDLKKEISACVWSDVLEPVEFEETWMGIMERYELLDVEWFVTMFQNRRMWVPAFFRDFPMGSLIRTTSVSECENSFYKTFTRPRSNLVEFLMCFDHTLAAQRNSSSKLDYVDSTIIPPFSTDLLLEKHVATKCVKVIPDKYYNGRWLKSSISKPVQVCEISVDAKQLAHNKVADIFFGYMQKVDVETIEAFSAAMQDFGKRIETDSTVLRYVEKRKTVDDFYFIGRPDVVEVHPPKVVRTRGSCNDSGSRIVSAREKAITLQSKPKRKCGKCGEVGHHDAKNCGRQKH